MNICTKLKCIDYEKTLEVEEEEDKKTAKGGEEENGQAKNGKKKPEQSDELDKDNILLPKSAIPISTKRDLKES